MQSDHIIDATGLICPLPVLKAKKILQTMQVGEVLKVIATDNAAKKDFPSFCEMTHSTLLLTEEEDGKITFYIQK